MQISVKSKIIYRKERANISKYNFIPNGNLFTASNSKLEFRLNLKKAKN